ncbi:MAG: acyl-CoA dehydrogenase family protein [Actinomycetota bacterium]|nr:acyl-CoA dehydrogenase family protein [Actinomycetota bacterium]
MDFELSDDQVALSRAAAELLGAEAGRDRVRAVVDAGGGLDMRLWEAMVDQGWLGVAVAESAGGLGLGPVEQVVLLEQVGAHVAPAPVLSQSLVLWALGQAGDGRAGSLLAGEVLACAGWESAPGRSEPVLYAPSAELAVVVRDGALVALDLGGRQPPREPAMDRTRELGWLPDGDVPSVRLGDGDAVAGFLDRGATFHAAELLGASSRALDMAVQYAKDRVQFGRPIGSFQAVKHRCADMLVDVEGMRSAVYWAAWCIGAGHPDASVAASTAKTWCSDAATRVMASALQVHGGIGFTWDHDVHLYLKRAQLDAVSFGDATFHRTRLAALLRARVEAGQSVL